ncbi:hypothetical protein CTI14_55440, partial [Methylobacterium radiotolerans]
WALLWSIIIAFAPLTSAETIIGPFGGGQIPVSWALLIGILGALASAAGIIGLALLARTLALAIVARAREVELFVVLRLVWALLWSIIIAFAPLTSAETIIGPFGGGQIPVS